MADLVIRGMEMPTNRDVTIRIDPNGEVYVYDTYPTLLLRAVPLQEGHGDLIDRDNVLLDIDCTGTNKFGMLDEDIRAFLRRYKPIVPAEGGEADGN